MRIHLYTLAWNEERVLPFFFRHYTKLCERIVVYDNESTDRTPELIRACPQAEHRVWSSQNQLNDAMYLEIKNNAYKESRGIADWVIVCDADEFLYHPRLLKKLQSFQRSGTNLPKVAGFEMLPSYHPHDSEDLPLVHREGVANHWLDKRIVFRPELDIRYQPGAHKVNQPAGARSSIFTSLKLLHYKMLSVDYYVQRHQLLAKRLSDINKENNWGSHYLVDESVMRREYVEWFNRRRCIV